MRVLLQGLQVLQGARARARERERERARARARERVCVSEEAARCVAGVARHFFFVCVDGSCT